MNAKELIEEAAADMTEGIREVLEEGLRTFQTNLLSELVDRLRGDGNGTKPKRRKPKKKAIRRGRCTEHGIVTEKPRKKPKRKAGKKGAGQVETLIAKLSAKRVQTPAELMRSCGIDGKPALQTVIFHARKKLKPKGLQIEFNKADGQYELKAKKA